MTDFFETPYGDSGCCGVRLAHGQVLRRGVAVERPAAGGEHDALGLGLTRPLEDVQRADDVDGGVVGGLGDRDPDVGLRGEMEDELGPPAGHQFDDRRRRDVEMVDRGAPGRRCPRASARLDSEPVEKSSTTSTSWPSASSRSTRFEPMKPAPPVTRVRMHRPS